MFFLWSLGYKYSNSTVFISLPTKRYKQKQYSFINPRLHTPFAKPGRKSSRLLTVPSQLLPNKRYTPNFTGINVGLDRKLNFRTDWFF